MRDTPQGDSRDFSSLVGIPYYKCNCFELVKLFYREILGVELNHYYEKAPEQREDIQSLIYSSKGDFKEVENPEFGDLVFIKLYGLESHIAVYVGNNKILHTLESTKMSVVESAARWRKLITGFYRIREKAE